METSSPPLVEPPAEAPGTPERSSVFRAVPWRWLDLVVSLAPFVLVEFLPRKPDPRLLPYLPSWAWAIETALGLAWAAAYPLVVARWRLGRLRLVPPRSIRVEVGLALAVLVPLFALMTLVTALGALVVGSPAAPNPLQSIASAPERKNLVALFILAVIVAPVAEELLFRGLIYNNFRRHRWGVWLAAPATGVLFGVYHHGFGLTEQIGIGLGGLILCLVYEWRRSLLAPMLVHAFQNLAGMILLTLTTAAAAASPVLGVVGVPDNAGLRITQVVPGSPAAAAGLEVGDILTAVRSQPTPDQATLTQIIRTFQPGDQVTLTVVRRGQMLLKPAVLKKRSDVVPGTGP